MGTEEKSGLKRFWCSWEAPDGIPKNHMKKKWPKGMHAWISGYGMEHTNWCAIVDAKNAREVKRIIRGCYGSYGASLTMRWEPEEKPTDWKPGDRFPMKAAS